MDHPVSRQLKHGLVLKEKKDTERFQKGDILCWGLFWWPKFQHPEKIIPFDYEDCIVFRKQEGIHVNLYSFEKNWYISTLESPIGENTIPALFHHKADWQFYKVEANKTFDQIENPDKLERDCLHHAETNNNSSRISPANNIWFEPASQIFWQVFKSNGYSLPSFSEKICFSFEMCLSKFSNILEYDQDQLYLIGARNLDDFQELDLTETSKKFGFKLSETIELKTLFTSFKPPLSKREERSRRRQWETNMLFFHSTTLTAHQQIGFVGVDKHFRRITIESPQYENFSLLKKENTLFWASHRTTNEKCAHELARYGLDSFGTEFLKQTCSIVYQDYLHLTEKYGKILAQLREVYQKVLNEKDEKKRAKEIKKISQFETQLFDFFDIHLHPDQIEPFLKFNYPLRKYIQLFQGVPQ